MTSLIPPAEAARLLYRDNLMSYVIRAFRELRGDVTGVPLAIKLLDRVPVLRRIPGRVIGLGFGRQQVESPLAKEFQ